MAGISRTFLVAECRKRLVVSGFGGAGGGSVGFPAWSAPVFAVFRRNAHENVYEKNLDDQLNPTTDQDEDVKPESNNYWAPNPNTGVFGPASGSQQGVATKKTLPAGQRSVLEEKAWFRPTGLEDLEKSP